MTHVASQAKKAKTTADGTRVKLSAVSLATMSGPTSASTSTTSQITLTASDAHWSLPSLP
jgi:hypothetical protein